MRIFLFNIPTAIYLPLNAFFAILAHMERDRINFLEPHQPPPEPKGRWWRAVIIGLILVAIGLGFYIFWQGKTPEIVRAESGTSASAIEPSFHRIFKRLRSFITGESEGLAGTERDRINILILGMGGPGHDGPYLTDTIIVTSIQPSTNRVAMLSIPRDMAAPIPGFGWYKINHANAFGEEEKPGRGGELAARVVEKALDEPMDYYVRIDFTAFEQLIDEVGGVDIQVDRSFVDQSFPAGPNAYRTVSFQKGAQHMDGVTALRFARSRHGNNGEGSDFARARRQQKVLVALKDQLLSLGTITNPVRIKRILQTLSEHVVTNISLTEILKFISLAQSVDTTAIKQHVLTNAEDDLLQNVTENGAFLLQPRGGDYVAIHTLVNDMFDRAVHEVPRAPEPGPPPSALSIGVYNGTWNAGLATRWQKWLQEQGFAVPAVGNTTVRPIKETMLLLTDEKEKKKAEPLIDVFGAPLTMATGTPLIEETPNVDVLVLLGGEMREPY